jgi:hypothetical protein
MAVMAAVERHQALLDHLLLMRVVAVVALVSQVLLDQAQQVAMVAWEVFLGLVLEPVQVAAAAVAVVQHQQVVLAVKAALAS